MLVVKADLEVCMGYANCVMAAEEYFDLDDEAGVVTVRQAEVAAADRPRIEEAVRVCPVNALTLTEG